MNHGIARVLAGALMVLAMVYVASSTWGLLHRGEPGFTTAADGTTIVRIAPGGGAARAGILPGDRLVPAQNPAQTRVLTFSGMLVAGTSLPFAVERNGAVRIVPVAIEPVAGQSDLVTTWVSLVKRPIAALLCLLAGVLLMLRPQRATWAFFCYALLNTISSCNQYWAFPWQAGYEAVSEGVPPLIVAALLYFAVAFLHEDRRNWHRTVVAVAMTGSVLLFLWTVIQNVQAAFSTASARIAGLDLVGSVWVVVETLVTIAILVAAYVSGRRGHRQRIAWVVAGIALAMLFEVFVPALVPEDLASTARLVNMIAYMLNIVSPLAVCLAVVYAMTQYRVIDVRFALNRALVYTVTTSAIVALLTLVEWSASRLFEGSHVAVYASIAAALLVGFTFNAFHKRIDDFVDLLFFRRERHSAERLKQLAASLQYADDEGTIGEFVVEEPSRLLDLASAAVFVVADSGDFRLGGNVGWDGHTSATIDRTDSLIPQLRAATAPLWLRDVGWHPDGLPSGAAEPLLALPIKARADLFGIVFYGGHSNGATLNVDERALLATLVSNAASAFDHIEATHARAELQRLEVEVEVLTRLRASTT